VNRENSPHMDRRGNDVTLLGTAHQFHCL
jgi:hypothetical protein